MYKYLSTLLVASALFLLPAGSTVQAKNIPLGSIKAYPNPLNNQTQNLTITRVNSANTEIGFSGSVKFIVYNLRLKKVFEDTQSAVGTSIKWGGHDSLGRRLPPGLYYIRLIETYSTPAADSGSISSGFIKVLIK